MPITLEPELSVPLNKNTTPLTLETHIKAAASTATLLEEHGLDVTSTRETDDIAAKLALSYASDPVKTKKAASNKRVAGLPPAALMTTHSILNEFGHSIVESAVQVRHLVTNKLIEETENPDPRVRIRALELLGKISDVGLFAEKSEVTITHQTTDELKDKLRAKLTKLVGMEEINPAIVLDGETIDLDEELGSTKAPEEEGKQDD